MPLLIITGLIAAALILRRINEAPELNLAGHEYAWDACDPALTALFHDIRDSGKGPQDNVAG